MNHINMCSITRAISANLQTIWGLGNQWTFRWICAYVQLHHSFLSSSTNSMRYGWPGMAQMSLKVAREGSDEYVHTCNLTRAISTRLQAVRYRWPNKVLMSVCINVVSPAPSLLIKDMRLKVTSEVSDESVHICSLTFAISAQLQTVQGIDDHRMLRWVSAYVQSHQSHYCLSTNGKRYRWPGKDQKSWWICAVSPELSQFVYTRYDK